MFSHKRPYNQNSDELNQQVT
jgi:hypothetical protein